MSSALLEAIKSGVHVVDLAQPLYSGMPSSPNHPGFRLSLTRRHGDTVRPDGGSAAAEMIVTGGHVGTHVDALAHVSQDGLLHGGVDAAQAQTGGRFTDMGIDAMPPLIRRGVLLDVAGAKGADVLDEGSGVTASDLEQVVKHAGVALQPGDVALIRTGWARHFDEAETYLGHATGAPGVTEDGARWLADADIVATGADTTAYEQIPAGAGHRTLPVHRVLLVEHGIHIIEHLNLEKAAEQGLTEFCFVLSPLNILGGTGSPVRPLAVTDT